VCGISGFIGAGNASILDRMLETLRHRGPDSRGSWIDGNVHLGMRRLAIVDLETGEQPVFNETKSLVTVFNGEIYNYVELREELRRSGHTLAADHSDTEVIVHLYEDFGADFLHHLNGMFAIALWDKERRELLLARDRIGIKPLYYALLPNGIVFGSEPKALLAHPTVSSEPDLVALGHYFSLKNVPAPMSAYKAIRQLRPGERLIWRAGKARTERWWRPMFDEEPEMSEAEAAAGILSILEDSVRLQMRSDVPIGAYLSGGVDSSSIVMLMAQLGAGNIDTFTLVYEDTYSNKDADRRFAREISKQCGTRHHEHFVRHEDVPEHLDEIVSAFDEPFSGVISTFFLTECIARHVKVALSGDGADELFASYQPQRLAQPLAAAARFARAGARLGDLSMDDRRALTPYESDSGVLEALLARGDEAARRMAQYIADDAAKDAMYTAKMRDAVDGHRTEGLIRRLYGEATTDDPLNRALLVDLLSLLPDQVLAFVDRLSMAHSVEVRPPFLDHRLVEFTARIPGAMKISQGRVKHILKEAVRGLLPAELLDRPKEGFIMPINDWILTRLRTFVEGVLSAPHLARHGLIDPEAVRDILHAHYTGTANYGNRIWNLVMFQFWWDKYQS
jgi:asparagine synthase (glutamine-hydrolysing)